MRVDGRRTDELRPVTIVPNYTTYAEGSTLITMGNTRVLCTATVEEGIPRWMQAQGKSGGWITGEYAMLPRSTAKRTPRESFGLGGRTHEIRRLIGRSLRAAVDMQSLGARTITIDCDVLQADGGTRTAAITGGFTALALALQKLVQSGAVPAHIIISPVAAVSVGIVDGIHCLDLCYEEDSQAELDANIVMNSFGEYIEVQCTAEQQPFTRSNLDALLNLAYKGIGQLLAIQKSVLEKAG
ncbi:MAG: ribonuclease PH [Anaerolineales bacterium]|nr:ribonuclease PH [Anaerolineales bacterium]